MRSSWLCLVQSYSSITRYKSAMKMINVVMSWSVTARTGGRYHRDDMTEGRELNGSFGDIAVTRVTYRSVAVL